MRRHDKEISTRREIDEIIRAALVCRIAFANGDEPYVVPISFGYDGKALFIHTATTRAKDRVHRKQQPRLFRTRGKRRAEDR